MAQLSFPLENTDYFAENAQLWFATRTTGVYSADSNLAVSAVDGMRVSVSPGIAWLNWAKFKGIVYGNTDTVYFDLDMADGVLSRIDRVVVRYDIIQNTVLLAIKKGVFSSAPTAQPLQRDMSAYEIVLADISIERGAVEVVAANITDQRLNESLCGLMADGVTRIPTAQLEAKFLGWLESLKTVLDGDTAGHLLNLIQDVQEEVNNKASIEFVTNEVQNQVVYGYVLEEPIDGGPYIATVKSPGNFTRSRGTIICINFFYAPTGNSYLDVNNTGPALMIYKARGIIDGEIVVNKDALFTWDGNVWRLLNPYESDEIHMEIFTSSGTFTVPVPGYYKVKVQASG